MSEGTYAPNYVRFSAWYLGLSVGLPLVLMLIERLTGYDLSSSGVSVIPMMLASLQEGVHFARTERARPQGARAWRISVHLAVLALALSAVLAVILWVIFPQEMGLVARSLGMAGGVVVIIVVAVLSILVARVFLGLGARNEMKLITRNAGKDTP